MRSFSAHWHSRRKHKGPYAGAKKNFLPQIWLGYVRVDDLEAWIGVAKRVPWVPTWSEVGLLALKKAKIESDPRHKMQIKGGKVGMYPRNQSPSICLWDHM